MINSFYGQANQDKFVCNVLKYKTKGFFVEIGSNHPIKINNTYILEKALDWTGLMFEIEKDKFEDLYIEHRPSSSHIFGDAVKHNYLEIFLDNKVPLDVDYLQVDIEPPHQSLNTLENLDSSVMSSYKFAVVTFEHDFCHGFHSSPRSKSRAILDRRGYKLVFPDIHNKESKNVYEDWYVNPELVDMNYVNNLINQNAKNYENSPFKEIGKSINWQNIKYDF